jgi:hypothetical protein
MGFGDKLKGLRDQAEQAVAEHKDQIQNAVQTVGATANEKTRGKYATKIMNVGEKVSAKVEHVASTASDSESADESSAADAPTNDVSTTDEPASQTTAEPGQS